MSLQRRLLVAICLLVWAATPPSLFSQQRSASPAGGAIEGSIVDDALTPIAGVSVALDRSGKLIATHQTDASGSFRFDGLEPGAYRISATMAGHASLSKMGTLRSATSVMRLGLAMARDGASLTALTRPAPRPAPPPAPASPFVPVPYAGPGGSIAGVTRDIAGTTVPGVTVTVTCPALSAPLTAITNVAGGYQVNGVPVGACTIRFDLSGFKRVTRPNVLIAERTTATVDITMEVGSMSTELTMTGASPVVQSSGLSINVPRPAMDSFQAIPARSGRPTHDTSSYAHVEANGFKLTSEDPVSTFGADVDTASYTNARRFLNQGRLPPADAVRVEEFVNYFKFDYPGPKAGQPISITSEVGACSWAPDHRLVLVGTRAQAIDAAMGRNLVFLVDVSGSMTPPARLPLIKTALRMFVDTLHSDDQISIVTYAGASGVALPPTAARHRERIHDVVDSLGAGGSTNGGAGLMLAYRLAREQFIPGGVNRILLATDGDFNVGVVGPLDLQKLIERERRSGVFLSVLGVGDDNYKDSTMEMLAEKGNGHYAYLDSLDEARRVLIREGGSTLETVAKDVKFQVEFNPAAVRAWRLIGYENRLMAREDFNDDRKDGGELGAGHTVTVLYEVVPAGVALPAAAGTPDRPRVDPLVYQADRRPTAAAARGEWLTVRVRYKLPEEATSQVIAATVRPGASAEHVAFAGMVAEFALLLREERPPAVRWDELVTRLHGLGSSDSDGDRLAFVRVVELAASLQKLRR